MERRRIEQVDVQEGRCCDPGEVLVLSPQSSTNPTHTKPRVHHDHTKKTHVSSFSSYPPPQISSSNPTRTIMASRRSNASLLVLVMLVLACLIHTSSAAMGVSPRLFCTVRGGAQQPSAFQRFMSVRGGMQVRVWLGRAGEGRLGWGRSGGWRDRKGT